MAEGSKRAEDKQGKGVFSLALFVVKLEPPDQSFWFSVRTVLSNKLDSGGLRPRFADAAAGLFGGVQGPGRQPRKPRPKPIEAASLLQANVSS